MLELSPAMVLPFVRTPPVRRPEPPLLTGAPPPSPPVARAVEPEAVLLAPPLTRGAATPDRAELEQGIWEAEAERTRHQVHVEDFRTQVKTRAFARFDALAAAVDAEVERLTGELTSEEWAHLREAGTLDTRLAAREAELESAISVARMASVESRRFLPARALQAEREIEARLCAELEECRRARVLLRAAHPALAVFVDPPDLSKSNAALASQLWLDSRKFHTHIDDAKNRIITGDLPIHKLDRLVRETLAAEGIALTGSDEKSVAIREWLDRVESRAKLIGAGAAVASLALGVASAVLTGGAAIAAGVAGSVIGFGASVMDLELADDLHAISTITITGEDGVVDPARARREYASAIASAVLGVVDLGLAGKGVIGATKSARAATAALERVPPKAREALVTELGTTGAEQFAAELAASGWDSAALAESLGAARMATLLAGLPVPQLARLRALLGSDGLAHAADVFGPETLRKFLGGSPPPRALRSLAEGLATPELRSALKRAAPRDVLHCLRAGVSGAQLARTLAMAEKLHPNVGLPELIGRYLGTVKPERLAREVDFAERALALEAMDDGHSLVRHGPQVTDALLDTRVKTGVAPDGVVAETRTSTRFSSFEAWYVTRQRAMGVFREKLEVDVTKPPPASWDADVEVAVAKANENGQSHFEVTEQVWADHVDIGPFGSGFWGDKSSKIPKKRLWTSTEAISGSHRSHTLIKWRAPVDEPHRGRWTMVQHFPSFDGFDPDTGTYAKEALRTFK